MSLDLRPSRSSAVKISSTSHLTSHVGALHSPLGVITVKPFHRCPQPTCVAASFMEHYRMGRFLIALAACLILAHCAPPVASTPEPSFRPLNATPAVAVLPATPDPAPGATPDLATHGPPAPLDTEDPSRTLTNGSTITFEGVAFDARSHKLEVVDQPNGPGSQFADAAAAAKSRRAIAAVNGGFFTPEGNPLGLVVTDGEVRGNWNAASSLGSGVFYESSDGSMMLTRRSTLDAAKARRMRTLLQAGPFLVDNEVVVGGLESTKRGNRTVLMWDGKHRWWIGQSSRCTLNELATAIATRPPVGWTVRHALNLDGGSSCELWISGAIQGGPLTRRPFFNKPARNFLVLVPR